MNRYLSIFVFLTVAATSSPAFAHCDTTKGPVVTAARAALESGDVRLVLHWVRPQYEAAVTTTFRQTMAVRALGPEAKALADRHFFETLVRIHRAGEGAPYTGLSDNDPEPIVAATDRALERGSAEDLERHLVDAVKSGLAKRFSAARAAKDFKPGDITAGRAFVEGYVSLTHWVEGIHSLAASGGGPHEEAPEHVKPTPADEGHHSEGPTHPNPAVSTADGGQLLLLPWIVACVLALVALAEGMVLVSLRRPRQ